MSDLQIKVNPNGSYPVTGVEKVIGRGGITFPAAISQ